MLSRVYSIGHSGGRILYITLSYFLTRLLFPYSPTQRLVSLLIQRSSLAAVISNEALPGAATVLSPQVSCYTSQSEQKNRIKPGEVNMFVAGHNFSRQDPTLKMLVSVSVLDPTVRATNTRTRGSPSKNNCTLVCCYLYYTHI